jgi:hypothetical protein
MTDEVIDAADAVWESLDHQIDVFEPEMALIYDGQTGEVYWAWFDSDKWEIEE